MEQTKVGLVLPELLLRTTVLEEYKEYAIQASIADLETVLKEQAGVWWNAYSQAYGVTVRKFPYEARNGFFINADRKVCTHRFESKGIVRRDTILSEKVYQKLVPEIYRPRWFDLKDASRTYSVLISKIVPLSHEISVTEFGLYNSWGKVSGRDKFHHPRLIKPSTKNQ